MTQSQRRSRQLELPMLSAISSQTSVPKKETESIATAKKAQATSASKSTSASTEDLSVYEKISANYFRSLEKARY